MTSLSTLSTVAMFVMSMPGILVGAIVAWAIMQNLKSRASGQTLPYPTHFNISEFGKAISAAFTGNIDAMKMAFDKSVDIQFKTGDRLAWAMDAVLDEWVARSKNPSAVMPLFDSIVQWSGIPRDALVAMVEHELRSRKVDVSPPIVAPGPSPAVPAAAAALVLFFCSIASAQSPMAYAGPSHWHADIHAPQSFRPTSVNLFAERPDQEDIQPIELTRITGNVTYGQVATTGRVYGPNEAMTPRCGQEALAPGCNAGGYYGNRGSYWYPGKVASAPFRAVARWRPLRRLFGRC